MNALSQPRLTAENFVAYVQDRAGRYELFDGVVVPQAAERASHAERKLLVCIALSEAIRKRKSACHVLPDGMAVKIAPAVADVLTALRSLPGSKLARMSGSGATCFALFATVAEARAAAEILSGKHPAWWVRATTVS